MNEPTSTRRSSDACASAATLPPRWQQLPTIAFALCFAFALFLLLPAVRENPRLTWSFAGALALLGTWTAVLWAGATLWGHSFRMEFVPLSRAHYIQGSVQLTIYAYWGWYHRDVYSQMPFVLAQLVFYYVFDGLLSWSRGRAWRLGCGPLPIILSTNVFLWFKPDWYVFQFALVATAALGKEFLRWQRNGRSVHIFNPSALGLALFAVVLLATDTTDATWAGRIADSFNKPTHIYAVIFLLGLIVQYFFAVTLMTLSAAATIALLSIVYYQVTGTYHFVTSDIPAPVFLGLHLLMTDPATSPRSNVGRVIFGALYGVLTFLMYGFLAAFDSYTVYDKLLPIPILNLSVRWIDRVAAADVFDWLRRIETRFQPRSLNLSHMAVWATLFGVMWTSGFVEAPHEGSTYTFWKKAVDEGRPNAAKGLINVLRFEGRNDNAAALNELGVVYLEGKIVPKDLASALRYFGKACKLGDVSGAANIVRLYLESNAQKDTPLIRYAFQLVEKECATGQQDPVHARLCYYVGVGYELGRGRPLDARAARDWYARGCAMSDAECCASAQRLQRAGAPSSTAQSPAAPRLNESPEPSAGSR